MRAHCRNVLSLGSSEHFASALSRGQHLGVVLKAEESTASTSGRLWDATVYCTLVGIRSFARSAAGESTSPKATGAAPQAADVGTPASPQPGASQSSLANSPGAPSYAGLAQRYPDPDAIPEPLLQRMRNELFGKPVRFAEQTGRRALARPLQGRVLADWYFMPPSELPGFHNEEREYKVSKELNRRNKKEEKESEEAPSGKGGKKK